MSDGRPGPVSSREIQGANVILIGDRQAFAILPQDIDTMAGETAATTTADVVRNLQLAMDEAIEMRTPAAFVRGAERTAVATLLFVVLLVVRSARAPPRGGTPPDSGRAATAEDVARDGVLDCRCVACHLPAGGLVSLATILMVLLLAYVWLTFVLRSFPYTPGPGARPCARS